MAAATRTNTYYPTWDVIENGFHSRKTKSPDVFSLTIIDPVTGYERPVLLDRAALVRLVQKQESDRDNTKIQSEHSRLYLPVYQTIEFLSLLSLLSYLAWFMTAAFTLKLVYM